MKMSFDSELEGESGDQKFDGLHIFGKIRTGSNMELAPGLVSILESEDSGNGTGKDVISVSFVVPGKKFSISLTNFDLSPTVKSHGEGVTGPQWYSFTNNGYNYRIIGKDSGISPEGRVYLSYRLTRESISVF